MKLHYLKNFFLILFSYSLQRYNNNQMNGGRYNTLVILKCLGIPSDGGLPIMDGCVVSCLASIMKFTLIVKPLPTALERLVKPHIEGRVHRNSSARTVNAQERDLIFPSPKQNVVPAPAGVSIDGKQYKYTIKITITTVIIHYCFYMK